MGEAGRRRRSVGGAAAPGGGRRWMGGGLGLDSGGGVGRRWRGVFDIAPSFFFNLYPFVTFFLFVRPMIYWHLSPSYEFQKENLRHT